MGFLELPAELQIQIFGYLDRADLKSARGVCARFHNNASPALFRSVVACARYQALGAFQKISLHSTYANYVKEIIFDGSAYDAALASNEQNYIPRADEIEDLRHGFSFQKHSRWKRYQQLWRDQEEMRAGETESVLFQTIAKALSWMPNVTSIIYSPGPHSIPAEAKDMRDILPRGIVDPLAPSHLQESRLESLQHGIHHLIGAIYYSQYKGIREFRVNTVQRGLPMNGAAFTLHVFDLDGQSLEAGKFFFRHLHKIELNISTRSPIVNRRTGDEGMLSNLATLLSEAEELRDLTFRLYPWKPDPHRAYGHIIPYGYPIFPHLGLKTKWLRLRSLVLGGIFANESDLISLVKQHGETLSPLKVLKFSYCSLTDGAWANIVDEVLYGTRIMPFILDHVNETMIGDTRFENMTAVERESWQYEGQVKLNSDGKRYFDEPMHKSVYNLRNARQVINQDRG